MNENQHKLTFLHTAARLEDILAALDAVHTAASENQVELPNGRAADALAGWLREIAYVAEQAAIELEPAETHMPSHPLKEIDEGEDGGRQQARLACSEGTPLSFVSYLRAGS